MCLRRPQQITYAGTRGLQGICCKNERQVSRPRAASPVTDRSTICFIYETTHLFIRTNSEIGANHSLQTIMKSWKPIQS